MRFLEVALKQSTQLHSGYYDQAANKIHHHRFFANQNQGIYLLLLHNVSFQGLFNGSGSLKDFLTEKRNRTELSLETELTGYQKGMFSGNIIDI